MEESGTQNDRTYLLIVPRDLFLCVTDYLDDVDLICLALCNRELYNNLKERVLSSVRIDPEIMASRNSRSSSIIRIVEAAEDHRSDILCRLARDHSDYFACSICWKLVASTRVGPLAARIHSSPKCNRHQATDTVYGHIDHIFRGFDYKFTGMHIDYAMVRHEFGPGYGIPLHLLSAREVVQIDGACMMLSVEPKVIADELCLRVQRLFLVPKKARRHYHKHELGICAHMRDFRQLGVLRKKKYDLISCKIRHLDQSPDKCPTCWPFLRCEQCYLEFHIDYLRLKDGRKALVITKMLNLGPGKNQGDVDRKWERHSEWQGDQRSVPTRSGGDTEIWGYFEAEKPLDVVTEENVSILRDETYKQDFTRLLRHAWDEESEFEDRWLFQPGTVIDRNWIAGRSTSTRGEEPEVRTHPATSDASQESPRALVHRIRPASTSQEPQTAPRSSISSEQTLPEKAQLLVDV